jgi:signal transduction histidine kinase
MSTPFENLHLRGIAHDFNNIMGAIIGYAEMLVENTSEGSKHRRYAQNVLSGANRASDLVEQILFDTRNERAIHGPVELNQVVAEAFELVRGSCAADIDLQLKSRAPASPLFVIGDPTQLHRIVMNLCTNAVHAIGEHGRLCVSVGEADISIARAFAHGTLAPGAYVLLQVEDSGRGMDAETLARIFEPFFTTKEAGKGTGLGLSLVQGIVANWGGAIDVTSAPGRGSTFSVYLPRVEARPR